MQIAGGRGEEIRNAEGPRQKPSWHIRGSQREPDGPKLWREVVGTSCMFEF